MYIHLWFKDVSGFQKEVIIFDEEEVKVSDVIQKKANLFSKRSVLRLYNEHGRVMKNREKVETGRVYTLRRRPRL